MQHLINGFLKLIKWPLAFLMVLLFVPLLHADITLVQRTINRTLMASFGVPLLGMIALWFVIPGLNGSHFAIFEHEFTHMVAALLTFHRPKSMRIESDKGGSFGFYGEGNWFITLAPYFFPTFPFLIMLSSFFWTLQGRPLPDLFIPVLGMMFGYHLISNAMQIHPEQTDFPKAGWIFSILFLPSANLLTFGIVWAFAARGFRGIEGWGHLIVYQVNLWLDKLI